jgi:hypothetical protein
VFQSPLESPVLDDVRSLPFPQLLESVVVG